VNADFYPILDKVASRGMRAERLIVVGDGENHPIASNDTAASRTAALN
jgi:outer membrane protein OmpA-like peptidoglycan-associated protein